MLSICFVGQAERVEVEMSFKIIVKGLSTDTDRLSNEIFEQKNWGQNVEQGQNLLFFGKLCVWPKNLLTLTKPRPHNGHAGLQYVKFS